MFKYDTSVKLHDTDAAGLLFFGHQFTMAHDAYEAFMASADLSFAKVLRDDDFLLPIVHASADYDAALFVGDPLTIEVTAEKISTHSFILAYRLVGDDGAEVGRVRTVHVCIDAESGEKKPLPDALRSALTGITA